jgi:hypothetical protein
MAAQRSPPDKADASPLVHSAVRKNAGFHGEGIPAVPIPDCTVGQAGWRPDFFHHEWKKEEAKEKLKRTVEAYRQFEQGQLPAGPGADALLASFRAVEEELADHEPGPA